MKMYIILYLIFISITCVFGQETKVDSSQAIVLRIDPNNAIGVPVSEIFDHVEFIPLETTNKSMFGRINQLEIADGRFIIFDEDTHCVLIFENNGRFKTKIFTGNIQTEDENKESVINGFRLTGTGNQTLIQIKTRKYSLDYDLNGKLVRKNELIKNQEFDYLFPNSQTTMKHSNAVKINKNLSYELRLYDKSNKLIQEFFPYQSDAFLNDDLLGSSAGFIFPNCNDLEEILYTRFYDVNIYKVNPERAIMAYQVILPEKNTLPIDFCTNQLYKGKRMKYLMENSDKFYGIFNTYLAGDNLFMNFCTFSSSNRTFVYNLKNNFLISMKDLEPDQLSSFLPVTDAGILSDYANQGFSLYKDGYIYNSCSSLAMFTIRDQNIANKPKYNETLSNYFKTQNRKSNPMLIKLKTKLN